MELGLLFDPWVVSEASASRIRRWKLKPRSLRIIFGDGRPLEVHRFRPRRGYQPISWRKIGLACSSSHPALPCVATRFRFPWDGSTVIAVGLVQRLFPRRSLLFAPRAWRPLWLRAFKPDLVAKSPVGN
jgi:hypothetical protein